MNWLGKLKIPRLRTISLLAIMTVLAGAVEFVPLDLRQPTLGPRKRLPAVFTKTAPGSIADLRAMQRHIEGLTAEISPTVVAVEVGGGSGSGVIISSNGLVLTAGHVCGRADRPVKFTLPDGRKARGRTVGLDEDSDTGLMRITDPGPWPCVTLAESNAGRNGDWVLALGHPGGFDAKRSLVVRLGRIISQSADALQTDCTISPGDSGGPLFDMHGRVIAIHSYISSAPSENFHVPIARFYDSWEAMASGAEGQKVKKEE